MVLCTDLTVIKKTNDSFDWWNSNEPEATLSVEMRGRMIGDLTDNLRKTKFKTHKATFIWLYDQYRIWVQFESEWYWYDKFP